MPRTFPADEPRSGAASKLDLLGLASAAAAVLLIVVPLVLGSEKGWPAWAPCCLAAGYLALLHHTMPHYLAGQAGRPANDAVSTVCYVMAALSGAGLVLLMCRNALRPRG